MTEYEKMGGTYRRTGDYILPNLEIATGEDSSIGVWAERHRRFLKSQHRVRYYNLLTAGKLNTYLAELDQAAENLFACLVQSLAEKDGVTEKLKAAAAMEWVQKMNNIRNQATEIVNAEVVYA